MEPEERMRWKARLQEHFHTGNKEARNQLLEMSADELWKLGPIVIRFRNGSGCPDAGCCEPDQWVMEEYSSHRYAQFAVMFADNVIKPVWRIVLHTDT